MNSLWTYVIYLAFVLVAVVYRNVWGALQSEEKFSWKRFLVSTMPAFAINAVIALNLSPEFNFVNGLILCFSTMGFSGAQGQILPSKKFQ